MAMALSSEVLSFISSQVNAIDDILLNGYGTVYKFAIKRVISAQSEYVLSQTEERLSAKNLFSNLWSVLDFCCSILYCCHNNKLPTLEQGMKIKFPCNFNGGVSIEGWEKRKISGILQKEVAVEVLSSLQGIFSHVQFRNGGEADQSHDVYYFYLLQYLRNTLTHNSIDIVFSPNHDKLVPEVPDIWRDLGKEVNVSSQILVPTKPWLDSSRNNRSSHQCKPFLDVLYNVCQVVEKCRDQILATTPWQKTFREKYTFELTNSQLIITHGNDKPMKLYHQGLHLECYGVEAELKEYLEAIRAK